MVDFSYPHFRSIMNQTRSATATDATEGEETTTTRLFNDVHFERWEPPPLHGTTWTRFPRLPAELRLEVWLAHLRRHRMIELDIAPAADEARDSYPGNPSQSRYYSERNQLGNVVSGRGYVLSMRGPPGYAAPLSPLLSVNHEARRAALSFYSVHLPFPGLHSGRVLYLSPLYDLFSIDLDIATLLADFLHDIKAYDTGKQGYVCKSFRAPPQVHTL